jgi:cell division protein FtsI/penicillin-binding protein 2
VQQIAEKYLSETVQYYDGDWGVAVVVYPQSGEVLAMATYPDFDPAEPLPADAEPNTPAFEQAAERLRNRAISDAYEPGSAFKPFVFCSALDDPGVRLSMDEVFPIHGPVHQFGRRTISDTHAYDVLTGSEVISKSSNIGMGMVGDRCGNERLYRYVRNMGFGDLTGIELPGEHTGMVNDFDRWTAYSTQSVPIGQEIAVTALQVATGFSVFCNGGVLYRPRVVRGLVGPDGQIAAEYGMVPVRQALSAETVQKFRLQALVETVKSGTGRITAPLPDYQVFGKTGTAQVAGLKGKGYGLGCTATFVCGAPSDNPRVVVVVSVQHPKQHSYYGGQVSAPAASRILGDTLRYLKVPAELAPAPPRTPPTRRR